jgi:YD repeat-containing protein
MKPNHQRVQPYGKYLKRKQNRSNAYCVVLALFIAGQLSPYLATADQAQYLYDELRRLAGVSDSTGVTAVYNYDAVGNLTSIDRFTPLVAASAFISRPQAVDPPRRK